MSIASALLNAYRHQIYSSAISTAAGRTSAAKILGESRRSIERHAAHLGHSQATQKRNPTKAVNRISDDQLDELAKLSKSSAMPKGFKAHVFGYMCISDDCSTRGINLELKTKAQVKKYVDLAVEQGDQEALNYLYREEGVPFESIEDYDINYEER